MDITVTDAVLLDTDDGGPGEWLLGTEVVHDDGRVERIAHLLPELALEQRAAELGMGPDDRDELLGVLLYEPYVPDEQVARPFDAPADEARELHLARIAAVRGAGRVRGRRRRPGEPRVAGAVAPPVLVDADEDPDTPLAVLLRELPLDAGRVAVLREFAEQRRAAVTAQRRQQPRTARAAAPRRRLPTPDELRAQLDGPELDTGSLVIERVPE